MVIMWVCALFIGIDIRSQYFDTPSKPIAALFNGIYFSNQHLDTPRKSIASLFNGIYFRNQHLDTPSKPIAALFNYVKLLSLGEGHVYIWDMDTRDCVHHFSDEGCINGSSVTVSPDDKYIVCGYVLLMQFQCSRNSVIIILDSMPLSVTPLCLILLTTLRIAVSLGVLFHLSGR